MCVDTLICVFPSAFNWNFHNESLKAKYTYKYMVDALYFFFQAVAKPWLYESSYPTHGQLYEWAFSLAFHSFHPNCLIQTQYKGEQKPALYQLSYTQYMGYKYFLKAQVWNNNIAHNGKNFTSLFIMWKGSYCSINRILNEVGKAEIIYFGLRSVSLIKMSKTNYIFLRLVLKNFSWRYFEVLLKSRKKVLCNFFLWKKDYF